MPEVTFMYEVPGTDNEVEVAADITLGRPAMAPSLNHAGEPEEDAEIEITDCSPIDISHLYYRDHDEVMKWVLDDLQAAAWSAYLDSQF